MAHDVFISYSTHDKTIADAVCAKLESQKIRCWIAPRDVPAGQPYAASLVKAIKASSVIVLIFSKGANQSTHVLREVSEAVDNGIPILPLKIEDVDPTEEMQYYIKSIHWLDAMNPPLERHLEKLANSVQALINAREEPPLNAEMPAKEAPAHKKRALPVRAIILLIIALSVFIGVGAWLLKQQDAKGKRLDFIIPNENLWRQSDNSYTIISKPSDYTIAWSDETIGGDFSLSAEVTSEQPNGQAQFLIYGDGVGFSRGCLIFTYGAGFALLTKDTIYHEGENFLMWSEGDFNFREPTHNFTIEITGAKANLYVDGTRVLFKFLPTEINHLGRIGLLQHWEEPVGVTYSNIRIKTLDKGD